jgi:copper chaperone NosL
MKSIRNYLIIPLLLLVLACKVEPEPIAFGKDHCHLCKMTLMDHKFGGEVVSTKGRIYKFDDTKCMVDFINSGYYGDKDLAFKMVIDYQNPGELIDATTAFYVKSPEIMSPMGGGIAAFSTQEAMNDFKKKLNGFYLVWGEVLIDFK